MHSCLNKLQTYVHELEEIMVALQAPLFLYRPVVKFVDWCVARVPESME